MSARHAAALATFVLATAVPWLGSAQETAPAGREIAPVDITGYWVALITDEWTARMITPPKGDYRYLPLNDAGRAQADAWDPAADEAAGNACKGYAAPALMRLPSRLHIIWQDPLTLRVDVDTGTQSRVFHFDPRTPPGTASWQGHSLARWDPPAGSAAEPDPATGALHVVTTNLRSGYLQKNGVPFSDSAYMAEYYNLLVADDGTEYLAIQIFLDDPAYLRGHWVRTVQFRREPNGDRWNPTPCSAY